jgi:hypothetical protein
VKNLLDEVTIRKLHRHPPCLFNRPLMNSGSKGTKDLEKEVNRVRVLLTPDWKYCVCSLQLDGNPDDSQPLGRDSHVNNREELSTNR